MLTKTVLVVAVCFIGATVSTLAQDEARIFQYSPIARLVREGQYRAEVWRRENASGKEELAWSSSNLHGSSEQAIAAACTTLRETFASSCTQTLHNAKAVETVREPRSVVTDKSTPPSMTLPANTSMPAPKEVAAASNPPGSTNWAKEFWAKVAAAASQPGSNWAKEFWTNQSRWGHGGGDGGGGGGGGGCQ